MEAYAGSVLGLTSIGLDGEELDQVSFLPKPRVHLPAGSLVATAEGCLKQAEAQVQVLEHTGIPSGLGEILVARVKSPGNCLIGGPSLTQAMARVRERLSQLGAEKLFIDGAFSRQSHALAGDALVLVVGAHRAQDMDTVVRSAALSLQRMNLPQADPALAFLDTEDRLGWLDHQNGFHPLPQSSLIGQTEALDYDQLQDAAWLYLPGALDSLAARSLVRHRKQMRFGLILRSPLALVMDDTSLKHLFLMNKPIRVLRQIKLAFVALNPYSPDGHQFNNVAFHQAMREKTDLPLINVLEEVSI